MYLTIVIFILIISVYNYCLFQYGNKIDSNKVFDMGHYYLFDHTYMKEIINIIPLLMMLLFIINSTSNELYSSIKLSFGYLIPIFIIRMITTFVTILPTTTECTEWKYKYSILGHCYDKVFSGHLATVIVLTYVFSKYNPENRLFYILLSCLEGIFLISTKSHYTIDIILAILITLSFIKMNIKVIL